MYVNPGNAAFGQIAGPEYVDKTGMIDLLNHQIGGPDNLICISRPRRFGKSYAAKMLSAYYDASCDSSSLFEHRAIADTALYSEHLNKYNVISLDIAGFISRARKSGASIREVPNEITKAIQRELIPLAPESGLEGILEEDLVRVAESPDGKRFVFIIDEWDAMIREGKDDPIAQEMYLDMLRSWFKDNSFTPKVVAMAYMTGILPIKKDGSQSAISDFHEFSILAPDGFAPYTGFTEEEVRRVCQRFGMNFEEIRFWYDGYDFSDGGAIYNPYSVMEAVRYGKCRSYWINSSASEAMTDYIKLNRKGLQETVMRLVNGEEILVITRRFKNDFEHFKTKDDVLTLLIHLGYLTYDANTGLAHIPNEEVREEFRDFLLEEDLTGHWVKLIRRSEKVLENTLQKNGDAVASIIEEIRMEQYAPQFNNNEQALRAIIKYAWFAAVPHYIKIEEVPSGKGIADVVYIPKPASRYPALVIELKWNEPAQKGISQIETKGYASILKDYGGKILLVSISYNPRTNLHTCKIREV